MIYNVNISIKTTKYKNLLTDLTVPVSAASYDEAAKKVEEQWGIFAGFKLGSVTPIGDPEMRVRKPLPHEIELEKLYQS